MCGPELSDIQEQVWLPFKDRDVIVFGIADNESGKVVQDFVNEFKLTYPVLIGTRDLYNAYRLVGSHVSPYPRDFIIGRNGLIAYAAAEYDPEAMFEVIEAQLNPTGVAGPVELDVSRRPAMLSTFPNPASLSRGGVRFAYQLPDETDAELSVYNVRGQLVRRLRTGRQSAGAHEVHWNGRDESGRVAENGVYLVLLQTLDGMVTAKTVLAR